MEQWEKSRDALLRALGGDGRNEDREWMIRNLRAILAREHAPPATFQRSVCNWARDALRRLGAEPTEPKNATDANSLPRSRPPGRS